jgi:hypothetical protein
LYDADLPKSNRPPAHGYLDRCARLLRRLHFRLSIHVSTWMTRMRIVEVIAALADGTTVVIERRSASDEEPPASVECRLQEGRPVTWLGENLYRLPDGTEAREVAATLRKDGRRA